MSRQFFFTLTDEEKAFLKDLVKTSILTKLNNEEATPTEPDSDKLKESLGAFVTLKQDGRLRGCIGNLQSEQELYKTIWNMARAAAFKDSRFPELTMDEFKQLDIEISVLSPITECYDRNAIEVGRHGLIVQNGAKSGLLLPQVAVEWGWNARQFLEQTCRKAGLDPSVLHLTGTNIFWFEAEVF